MKMQSNKLVPRPRGRPNQYLNRDKATQLYFYTLLITKYRFSFKTTLMYCIAYIV